MKSEIAVVGDGSVGFGRRLSWRIFRPFFVGKLGLLALTLVAPLPRALAVDYFVDVETGSDSNPGTSMSAPWAHLPGTVGLSTSTSGWRKLVDGDTVTVKGGTLNNFQVKFLPVNYSGASRFDSIVVRSGHLAPTPWGVGRAIFDGQNTRTYGLWFASYGPVPAEGVTVDGFEVRNIASGGVGGGFDLQNGSCCIAVGASVGARYITIRRCWLHDALRNADDRGHGIETTGNGHHYIFALNEIGPRIGTKAIEAYNTHWGVISNNWIHGSGDHALVISGTNWDVCNNLVKMEPPFVHDPVYAIKLNKPYCDVWNNFFFRDDTTHPTVATDRAQGLGVFYTGNCRVYHNVFYNFANDKNGREYGVGIAVGPERMTVSGCDVQNNISYRCQNLYGGVQFFLSGTSSGNRIASNCFFHDAYPNGATAVVDATKLTVSAFDLFDFSANDFHGNLAENPGLVGGQLPDGIDGEGRPNRWFHALRSDAPAALRRTANVLVGDPKYGFNGASDKFAYDMQGARRYHWSMGAVDDDRPLPASNLRVVQSGQ